MLAFHYDFGDREERGAVHSISISINKFIEWWLRLDKKNRLFYKYINCCVYLCPDALLQAHKRHSPAVWAVEHNKCGAGGLLPIPCDGSYWAGSLFGSAMAPLASCHSISLHGEAHNTLVDCRPYQPGRGGQHYGVGEARSKGVPELAYEQCSPFIMILVTGRSVELYVQ